MKTKIKTGILSYGFSGQVFHAPFIHAHPEFSLDAMVERSTKKAADIYPGIKSYDSVEQLLDDSCIELVVVNTPNHLHYEHAKAALNKGKHVLVEKPFTITLEQAEELFGLAEKKNLQIFVYHNRRWDSDFMSVRNIIESGKLGKLSEVHFRYDRYKKELSPKYFKEGAVEGGGVSYDLGPHLLDQVISLFGCPTSYRKVTGFNRPGTKVDDYFFVQMSYPEGLNVTVTSNLLVVDPQPAFILHGINGSYIKERSDVQEAQLMNGITPDNALYGFEPEPKKGKLTLMDAEGNIHITPIEAPRGNYTGLFDAVYGTLRQDKPYPIKAWDVLCQLRIIGE
ncbi:Gfo/Idh/MocA family oxidoreductase [Bacteroides sp. 224]|uniref:Gfo/Idh/MocA family oxidoreductase n=1 Tax=Bacteroides sp. 224 TaxID=2302936 RepID=UPI0013D4A914|nr:Gfo/Idh/MocA family oxidoreductase [Bacteroides sp. 224]NDV65898.1 oxidoreductase [Bacteroides sp. 224]